MQQSYLDALVTVEKCLAVRLNYQVEMYTADAIEAARCLDGNHLGHCIEKLASIMPGTYYGIGHAHNGRDIHVTYSIGLEYKQRVVYVRFLKTFVENWDKQMEAILLHNLEILGIEFQSSESYVIENTDTTIRWRYWWGS
jgi:hypothetical protein